MLEILQAVSDILYLMILHVKQAKKIVSMTNWKNGWHSEALPLVGRAVVWRRHLRVPWTARRSNQSILKEISPEYSLQGLMLKLKLQYFGHLMRRTDSLEKTLMLGKTEGGRRGD